MKHGKQLQAMIGMGLRVSRRNALKVSRGSVAWGCQLAGYRRLPPAYKRLVRRALA